MLIEARSESLASNLKHNSPKQYPTLSKFDKSTLLFPKTKIGSSTLKPTLSTAARQYITAQQSRINHMDLGDSQILMDPCTKVTFEMVLLKEIVACIFTLMDHIIKEV